MSSFDETMGNSLSYDDEREESDESPHRHTQFLDLTNGEGGDQTNFYEDDDDDGGGGADEEEAAAASVASKPAASGKLNPTTPGKVVETGQEHTGRWTREEHAAFLSALKTYGKEWKKVAAKVKTRTVVQTRTHAQKYFQKLQKALQTNESKGGTVEMGVDARQKALALKKKQQQQQQYQQKKPPIVRSQSTASTHAAAHLMTNLANGGSSTSDVPAPPVAFAPNTTSSSFGGGGAPYSTAQSLTPSFTTHGFSSANNGHNDQPLLAPQSIPSYPGGFFGRSGSSGSGGMSITAPEHDAASRMGKFPEPSPAATGKRKLAEIAAAQMLAGVMGGKDKDVGGDTTPPPPEGLPDIGQKKIAGLSGGMSLQIVNPETLGIGYDESSRRKRGPGGSSPTTPWDGDLDALVSEKLKEEATQDEACGNADAKVAAVGSLVSPFMHPVCGPASAFGRSTLHRAVCDMNVLAIQSCGTSDLAKRDDAGYCPLHTAAALSMLTPSNTNLAFDICKLLIDAGADASYTDLNGNTPLHWAARAGNERAAHLMMLHKCQTDVQNNAGETPLHWAMRTGQRGIPVVKLLVDNGALASLVDKQFKRPIDVAVLGFPDDYVDQKNNAKGKKSNRMAKKKTRAEVTQEKREVRANLLSLSGQSRTLVLHHPECQDHVPKSVSDWECPDRVVSIMQRIVQQNNEASGVFPHEVTISSDFDRASLEVLSRVHSAEYLSFVNKLSKDLEQQQRDEMDNDEESPDDAPPPPPTAVPFTPMVQRKVMKEPNVKNIKQADHSDTSFSSGSLRAARRAAGAVQHAIDCVLVGRNRNAFCVVRPPGHHAGIQGLLAGGESCGFCIFNNVAAGALHALSDERDLCKRCAIVDLDVHHGNGTEEIVKKCHDPAKLLFFSIHLYDNDKKRNRQSPAYAYKFYPGTGEQDEIPYNIINVPISPLWREQTILPKEAGPPPAPQNTHNTRQKVKQKGASATNSPRSIGGDEGNTAEGGKASDTDSETASRSSKRSSSSTAAASPRYVATGRHAYRRAVQDRLLPALRAFNPDLIVLSLGLDAAKGDVGNARHYVGGKEAMGLDLEPQDYAWATRKVLEIADICCHGRVVSVLEGGYGRTPETSPEDPAGPQLLDKTVFSECALRHLQAMVDPYDAEVRFPADTRDVR